MGIIIPCCPDVQPPDDFLDVECIAGDQMNDYRVILLDVMNPTSTTTQVRYQVCRCNPEEDISHVNFEICPNGPTPLETGGADVIPAGQEPDELPYTSVKFDFIPENDRCIIFTLSYDVAFTEEDLAEIEVSIKRGQDLFFGNILGPCFPAP